MRVQQAVLSVELHMAIQKQEFSRILKTARAELGLSQEKAAHAIGVATKTYNQWEAVPGSWPRPNQYNAIAQALNIDRDLLMGPMEVAGSLGNSARLDEIARISVENNQMLRAVLAHLGISVESLAEPPADLIAALGNGKTQRGKSRRRV